MYTMMVLFAAYTLVYAAIWHLQSDQPDKHRHGQTPDHPTGSDLP